LEPIFKFGNFESLVIGKKLWISLGRVRHQHGNDGIVIGRECYSLAELEAVADEIRADLDRVMQEARQKFGG
jgi:hypothetical protein